MVFVIAANVLSVYFCSYNFCSVRHLRIVLTIFLHALVGCRISSTIKSRAVRHCSTKLTIHFTLPSQSMIDVSLPVGCGVIVNNTVQRIKRVVA
jgi:hypothetical protein